jgi:type IV pilus assembly protein PilC
MQRFFYIARDRSGKKITGFEEASTAEEAASHVQARDLTVINIVPELKDGISEFRADVASKSKYRPKHYRVTGDDLVLFCRQLATLLGAGVTMLKSLEIIGQQVSSRRLYAVIKSLQKEMEGGLSLHESMAKHPEVFSELWVNLVESGEASGNLAMVLSRLASYLERNAAFRRKIVSAMVYPMILMVAGLSALLFMTIKIVPTFAALFTSFNITLPLLTRILIGISAFIRKFFLFITAGIIAGVYFFRKYTAQGEGRRQWEQFLFSLPVFGEFFRTMIMERFSSEMSTLVESGVPILYSLEITEHSVANLVMADIIRQIKEDVREGKTLNQAFERSGFFEPMTVQMVTIGEEIGELSNMLKRLNVFYQEYVETFLVRFTSMFEPIMLVIMGIMIGVMVIGMFMPIFQISQIGGTR